MGTERDRKFREFMEAIGGKVEEQLNIDGRPFLCGTVRLTFLPECLDHDGEDSDRDAYLRYLRKLGQAMPRD